MKKNFLFYLLIGILTLSIILTGCNSNNNDSINESVIQKKSNPIEVNMGFVDGIPALSMAKLAKDLPILEENYNINYELIKGSDLIVAKIMNEELDMAIIPSNLAATAYNQSGGYVIGTLSGFGNLYIISRESIDNIEDLKGKEITTIGKGLTPDIVFQYILKSNNIDPEKDISINYLGGATELAPAFLSGKSDIVLAPEPMISTILSKDNTAQVQFNLNQLFADTTGSELGFPQTAFVIKKDFANNHANFIPSFLDEYEKSIKWATSNPQQLEEYGIELDITVPAGILNNDSIKRMNLNFVSGDKMNDVYMKYMNVLLEFQPKAIGGKLPDEGIFFTK